MTCKINIRNIHKNDISKIIDLQKESFSDMAAYGVLGEDLLSKKFSAQKVKARLKVMLYNKFISL